MNLFVDYETYGTADLPSVGAHEYLEHPDTKILMVGIWHENSPVMSVRDELGPLTADVPVSWGPFDRLVYEKVEKLRSPWIDAQALALMCGLPKSLEAFCRSVGIEARKDPRGTRLINTYCKPGPDGLMREMSSEERKAMEDYCIQDVRLLRQAWGVLGPLYPEWARTHKANYEIVARMNDNGVPIDVEAVERALAFIQAQEINLHFEFTNLTGLRATQTEEVRKWFDLPDVKRSTLLAARFDDPTKEKARDIRLQLSNATVKKLKPMLEASQLTGRVRGCFVANGAHTGRCTSHLVQFQNMKRSKVSESYFDYLHRGMDMNDAMGEAQNNIRGFVYPGPDKVLVVADYAQIEVRVLAWMAQDEGLLHIFKNGGDPYKQFASLIFNRPIDKIDDHQRQLGKITILGAGYGVGGPGLARQATNFGVTLTDRAAWDLVNKYRETFAAIPAMWAGFDRGLKWLIRGTVEEFTVGRCAFELAKSKKILLVTLPSGRKLRYMYPKWEDGAVAYTTRLGVNTTRKRMWGGHVTENLCQAIAADLKFDAMQSFPNALIAEVHDEIILEVDAVDGEWKKNALINMMEDMPQWAEEMDGLIKAEGSIMRRYSK